jgi:hypothetical protein
MMIGGIGFWVTGATFNSLSVISWRSVLLVEKTGVHRGGDSFPSQIDDKIYQIMIIEYTSSCAVIELASLALRDTDYLLIDRHMYIKVRENRRDNQKMDITETLVTFNTQDTGRKWTLQRHW